MEQDQNALGPEGTGALAGALEKMVDIQTLDLVSWAKAQCQRKTQD
jgi:hypothetical protein